MEKTIINPWQWQDSRGFVQAVEVAHGSHTLVEVTALAQPSYRVEIEVTAVK